MATREEMWSDFQQQFMSKLLVKEIKRLRCVAQRNSSTPVSADDHQAPVFLTQEENYEASGSSTVDFMMPFVPRPPSPSTLRRSTNRRTQRLLEGLKQHDWDKHDPVAAQLQQKIDLYHKDHEAREALFDRAEAFQNRKPHGRLEHRGGSQQSKRRGSVPSRQRRRRGSNVRQQPAEDLEADASSVLSASGRPRTVPVSLDSLAMQETQHRSQMLLGAFKVARTCQIFASILKAKRHTETNRLSEERQRAATSLELIRRANEGLNLEVDEASVASAPWEEPHSLPRQETQKRFRIAVHVVRACLRFTRKSRSVGIIVAFCRELRWSVAVRKLMELRWAGVKLQKYWRSFMQVSNARAHLLELLWDRVEVDIHIQRKRHLSIELEKQVKQLASSERTGSPLKARDKSLKVMLEEMFALGTTPTSANMRSQAVHDILRKIRFTHRVIYAERILRELRGSETDVGKAEVMSNVKSIQSAFTTDTEFHLSNHERPDTDRRRKLPSHRLRMLLLSTIPYRQLVEWIQEAHLADGMRRVFLLDPYSVSPRPRPSSSRRVRAYTSKAHSGIDSSRAQRADECIRMFGSSLGLAKRLSRGKEPPNRRPPS